MKEIIKNSNGKTKLSMIIMGAGQLAYGRIGKGLLFLLSSNPNGVPMKRCLH